MTLNTRVGYETRASDLVSAINADADASSLVTARVRPGVASTNIATPAINYSPLTMKAANVASVTSSFNAGSALAIQFTADQQGTAGNGIAIQVTQGRIWAMRWLPHDLGDGHDDFGRVEFEHHDADHGSAVGHGGQCATRRPRRWSRPRCVRATPDTLIGNRTINYSPLILAGANDVRVRAGLSGPGGFRERSDRAVQGDVCRTTST